MPASLHLKANTKARVLSGHPWVFANEVEQLLPAEFDGGVVECRDGRRRFLGAGIYNSRSQIIWRRLSRARVDLDETFLRDALKRALARRGEARVDGGKADARYGATSGGGQTMVRRLVWSESDDLPGLVVDQFGDTLVMQIQTLAMERHTAVIGDLLVALTGAGEIILRNDAPVRRLEGLPRGVSTRSGRSWEPRWMAIDGVQYWLDLEKGQKTGFYLDQRVQHQRVARFAAGRRVLDAFCNQGPFALHCTKAGAAAVRGIDSAEDVIEQARRNAGQNRLQAEFTVANVFDYLAANRSETWELIVLDPPPFARSRGALAGAMRGYKEINLRAMQRLAPGGVLATYSCSHHVQDADFRAMLAGAAADAKRRVQVLEFCHQPPDHPVLVTMPESEYLRGCILRVE